MVKRLLLLAGLQKCCSLRDYFLKCCIAIPLLETLSLSHQKYLVPSISKWDELQAESKRALFMNVLMKNHSIKIPS